MVKVESPSLALRFEESKSGGGGCGDDAAIPPPLREAEAAEPAMEAALYSSLLPPVSSLLWPLPLLDELGDAASLNCRSFSRVYHASTCHDVGMLP